MSSCGPRSPRELPPGFERASPADASDWQRLSQALSPGLPRSIKLSTAFRMLATCEELRGEDYPVEVFREKEETEGGGGGAAVVVRENNDSVGSVTTTVFCPGEGKVEKVCFSCFFFCCCSFCCCCC